MYFVFTVCSGSVEYSTYREPVQKPSWTCLIPSTLW